MNKHSYKAYNTYSINRFIITYKSINNESDNILINKNIQLFLIDEFKGVNVYKNIKI